MKANNKKAYNGISAAIVILASYPLPAPFTRSSWAILQTSWTITRLTTRCPGGYFGTVC